MQCSEGGNPHKCDLALGDAGPHGQYSKRLESKATQLTRIRFKHYPNVCSCTQGRPPVSALPSIRQLPRVERSTFVVRARFSELVIYADESRPECRIDRSRVASCFSDQFARSLHHARPPFIAPMTDRIRAVVVSCSA